MSGVDKVRALAAVRACLEADLEAATASQNKVLAGTVHPEAKQEGSKDTRAIESGYLARGLAMRVEELQVALVQFDRVPVRQFSEGDAIGPGALVTTESEEAAARAHFLVLPVGAGTRVEIDHHSILVVTPKSPVGQALIGRFEGDDVRIVAPGGVRDLEVTAVT
ncbi:MAG: transcription elongation GreA/GreB family factor [Myxococcota bacterium]|jgi:transcription elongation GreA/GreB family factor